MPVYNCAEFISDAMDSVLNQSETDLELIVVNDGSTDETLDIVNSKAQIDARVQVVSQPNSGKPAIARNRGLRMAKGEYIAFLDGDDIYQEDKIEKSLMVFKLYPNVDMVFHDVCLMDRLGNRQDATYLEAVDFSGQVLLRSDDLGENVFRCDSRALFFFMCIKVTTILTNSPLIRRKTLFGEEAFFPENLAIGEDIDLFFRLVKKGETAFIDQPLSSYRVYPQSITHRKDRNRYDSVEAHIRNYRNNAGFLNISQRKAYRKRIAKALFDIAYGSVEYGCYKKALYAYFKSLRWHLRMPPFKGIIKTLLRSATHI